MNRTKKITSLLALTLSCIAIMSAGIGLYIFYLKNLLQKDTTTYLQEVAKRSTQILNTQILGDIRSLQSTAAAISANTDGNFEKKECNSRHLYRYTYRSILPKANCPKFC